MTGVLVYVPTYRDTARQETLDRAVSLQFEGRLAVEVCDGALLQTDQGKPANLLAQQHRARQMALDGGFDALLFVEHDMLVPADVAQAMFDTGKPVVYAPYLFRHGMYTLSTFQYVNDRNMGQSLGEYPAELAQARKAGLWRISGTGWGCTMVRREVLERITFHQGDAEYSDIPFSRDCLHNGIAMFGLFTHPCLHYDPIEKLWLDPWKHRLGAIMKVEVLQSVNVNVGGQSVRLTAGETVDLPGKYVSDLVRAGYVKAQAQTEEAPKATKTMATRRRKKADA